MDEPQDFSASALAQRLLALLPNGAALRPPVSTSPPLSAPPLSAPSPESVVETPTTHFNAVIPPHAYSAPSPPANPFGFSTDVDPRIAAALANAGQRVSSREAGRTPEPVSANERSFDVSSATPTALHAPFGFAVPIFPDSVLASRAARTSSDAATSSAPDPRFSAASVPMKNTAFGGGPFNVEQIRREFPILSERVHGRPLIWFDNAATTQKPQCVIDALVDFYQHANSNIHRAAHALAARATEAYESARRAVRDFLGAGTEDEIVFVRGTTEGINLVAQTYGRQFLQPGDEIVLTTLEHHANIVPWQMVARERGAVIRVAPVNDRGEIVLEEYQRLLGPRTRLVGLTQASNSLGTIPPVAEMIQMAKRHNARVLVDGAQSVAHLPVDVQSLGCDFFVFSGHKIFGPTGIGAVYVRREWLELMPPWQGGGNMIRDVTFEETRYAQPPAKFEAGTPNIADAVGLHAALEFVRRIGLDSIARHEHDLLEYATERLSRIPGLRIIGTAREKVSVLSFVLRDLPPEQVGKALDREGIAVRSGHHCAQPSLRRFGLEATVRPSFSLYNTRAEIDHMVDTLRRL